MTPSELAEANEALVKRQLAAAEEAYAQKDWLSYILLFPTRQLDSLLLLVYRKVLTDAEYWNLVEEVWTMAKGSLFADRSIWLALFLSSRPGREACMTESEHADLATLPDPLTIYRGVRNRRHARGMSWTTDKAQAEWFANRFGGNQGLVYSGVVAKREVLAYFTGRKESEVVIDPRMIRLVRIPQPVNEPGL